jgi:proteic killer suppression protein
MYGHAVQYGTRIRSFRHKGLKLLYETGSRRGVRADLAAKIEDILHAIDQATRIEQVGLFPGWKLHPLKGGRRGEWSVWVSGNYRFTFRVEVEDVFDLDFEDYHGS